jgi:predicted transport protein
MIVRLSFTGRYFDAKSGRRAFLKPEYMGKKIEVDYDDRSSVVRTFMGIFVEREYSSYEIKSITQFLKRYHLNRAEILAVIHHLGYRYHKRNTYLGHVSVAGYLDFNPNKTRGYKEEDNLDGLPSLTVGLYQEFKKRVLGLGDNIRVIPWKKYVSFLAGSTFVDVLPQMLRLKVWINLSKGELDDPKSLARDVSEIEHWGNGDYQVFVESSENLDYFMTLIKQAYTKHS